MARKVYLIENLDCANCAAKIERKFNELPQVEEAVITFSTMQLRLTAEDPDAMLPELTELARTVEAGVVIRPRDGHAAAHSANNCACGHHHEHDHHHDHEGCACGHHHEHDHHHDHGECACGHHHEHEDHHGHAHSHGSGSHRELIAILLGAVLFVAGLILEHFSWNLAGLILSIAAYVLLGWEVVATAGKNLVKGHVFDENFLMALASLGAFCIGEHLEGVGVMLFYRIGEYFEERAVERSRSQIMEAVDLRPETVNLMVDGQIRTVPADSVRPGDVLLVRPGDRIPLDGVVLSGQSRIDTAPITGEPVPVGVDVGSQVISGCVNTTGQITMRVEKPLSESMVSRILDSVENAAASKPQIDRFITRFARIYTPVVVVIAAATAVLPSLVTGDWNCWVYTALSFLVMSCPCALVLSVPLAFFSGIGAGSKRGILFKGGMSIEAMGKVRAVVMDKTGTVTRGEFRVQQVTGQPDVLQLCASCEQHSTHPIAQSIVAAASEAGLVLMQPDVLEELPGLGIRAQIAGKQVLCGNARLLRRENVEICDGQTDMGTLVYVAVDGAEYGRIYIADTIKEGAAEAVRQLHGAGITTAMLTGDGEDAARTVARATGIREVYAKLLPDQKLEKLNQIRQERGAVMFVGDGINDAPVLAGADVGAAMGSGADAAIEAADVVFMTSGVEAIPQSLEIARKTNRIAWQNVIFALTIKAIVMVLGLAGYASMWLAVFADSGVAMLCVLNSIRLLYRKT